MARKFSAAGIGQAYRTGMANASGAYTQGVMNVQESPGLLASQQRDKYLAGVNSAVDRWQANVAAVSLSSWQSSCQQKASRLTQGGASASGKYESFFVKNQGSIQSLQDQISQAKKSGANGEELSALWQRGMKAISGKGQ